ncbi:MAG: ubiquinol-cytochrome c reductase iron-sulfur subunit [Georgfuchsia sp.]
MSCNENMDCNRRRLLVATSVVGGVAGITVATPFVLSMNPSERAKSAGAPVEADFSKLDPGQMMTVEWRGKPVWIIRRTPEMIDSLKKADDMVSDPNSERPNQPDYAKNETRSIKPEYMVMVGICTHLGCSPGDKFTPGPESGISADWPGGFLCPCHGSTFDLAGRVFKNKPAPDNMIVPPYKFVGETKIVIGEDNSTGV